MHAPHLPAMRLPNPPFAHAIATQDVMGQSTSLQKCILPHNGRHCALSATVPRQGRGCVPLSRWTRTHFDAVAHHILLHNEVQHLAPDGAGGTKNHHG